MSGHSKWATIKRKKAKFDTARGKVFTKVVREITVAAREGGGDPAGNARLRLLLEKAKSVNMPQDNIIRAIKKGTGELEGANYEAVRYEGYGPGGVAVIVESLTDNKNRTVSDLRLVFTRYGGKLGETGTVGWMFEHKGVITLKAAGQTEDEILEKLIDYNIEDISSDEETYTLTCSLGDLDLLRAAALKAGFIVESTELEWIATTPIETSAENEEKVYKFLEALEELDDVSNVYSNLK